MMFLAIRNLAQGMEKKASGSSTMKLEGDFSGSFPDRDIEVKKNTWATRHGLAAP
ncbi:hypothetical protein OS42_19060 [Dickeya oryzae]